MVLVLGSRYAFLDFLIVPRVPLVLSSKLSGIMMISKSILSPQEVFPNDK
jgi:hypothetical protein